MDYCERLKLAAHHAENIICLGIDPVIEKIPIKEGSIKEKIVHFYAEMLEAMLEEKILPAMAKPNSAYFEQYGFEGMQALKEIIAMFKKVNVMVLIDAKRGDIGTTSAAYAKAIFEVWGADAMTVAPYMCADSIGPFTEYCKSGEGVYVLTRTSNNGAKDLQDIETKSGKKLYEVTASHIVHSWHREGIGAVVGATYPEELESLSHFFVKSGKHIPLLIPGVGSQGGSAQEVVAILKKTHNPLYLHRINSSSAINYAYLKEGSTDFAGAAVRAMKKLKEEIGMVG